MGISALTGIVAEIPLTLLVSLSQHKEVLYVFTQDAPYPNLDPSLNRLIVLDAAQRLTDESATVPEPINIHVVATDEGYANIRRFLKENNLSVTNGSQRLPVRLLGPMSQLTGLRSLDQYFGPILCPTPSAIFGNESPAQVPQLIPQSRMNQQTAPTKPKP
jgi:hypothetical protein